jgi:hypothetical protein
MSGVILSAQPANAIHTCDLIPKARVFTSGPRDLLRIDRWGREIPFDSLRSLRAGSSLRLKNSCARDDASVFWLRGPVSLQAALLRFHRGCAATPDEGVRGYMSASTALDDAVTRLLPCLRG